MVQGKKTPLYHQGRYVGLHDIENIGTVNRREKNLQQFREQILNPHLKDKCEYECFDNEECIDRCRQNYDRDVQHIADCQHRCSSYPLNEISSCEDQCIYGKNFKQVKKMSSPSDVDYWFNLEFLFDFFSLFT